VFGKDRNIKFPSSAIVLAVFLLLGAALAAYPSATSFSISNFSAAPPASAQQKKQQVTLTAMLEDQGDPVRWKSLVQPSLQELRVRHPSIDININYTTYPYNQTRMRMLTAIANGTPVDFISLDQIWLGEFVGKGYLTDLTNQVKSWGRIPDWYPTNFAGGVYKGKVYSIWSWTDARGIWYWKDLLNQAGVDPNSLKTWDGYIASAKKLNAVLRPQGIEGIHLTAAPHSPDMWYPYLWMLGGDILKEKNGHPTKGTYWFPAYNGTEGVKAMEFIKMQIDAGIKPQKKHFWGEEFLNRKFAVMIEALQHHIPLSTAEKKAQFEQKVGFIPMFPVPDPSYKSATLMGGWQFSVPRTSMHKDLAWELIAIMLEPKILAPYLAKHANLPTQIPIGQGPYAASLNQTIPYYDQLVSMVQIGHSRPSIPEYPQIADHIRQALDEVFYGLKQPKQALDDAAAKSAKVLGW
jgi:multiple sugar transport system substrate-binding protein